jgi:SAM-dependent methyltransferase
MRVEGLTRRLSAKERSPSGPLTPRARLLEHHQVWNDKPVLRDIYAIWFDALLASLGEAQRVLEVGSGPGFLAAHARQSRPRLTWIALDVVEVPWSNVVGDAERLPVADASMDAVAALDLLHHLERPSRFFTEARRVLRPGGVIAAVEPWVTPFSFPIYRWLHAEGCRPGLDPWAPFPRAPGERKDAFQGDAAVVWRLVRSSGPADWAGLGFEPPRVLLLNGFAYLASLGFHRASLLPRRLAPVLRRVDALGARLAAWTGMRALVVWRCA